MKYIVILVPARHRLRLRRGGRVFVTLWLNYYEIMNHFRILVPARHRLRLRRGGRVFVTLWLN